MHPPTVAFPPLLLLPDSFFFTPPPHAFHYSPPSSEVEDSKIILPPKENFPSQKPERPKLLYEVSSATTYLLANIVITMLLVFSRKFIAYIGYIRSNNSMLDWMIHMLREVERLQVLGFAHFMLYLHLEQLQMKTHRTR